jgi:hypothetical protein
MNRRCRDYVIQLPPDWTPEQAFAVHDLLTELAGGIWEHYETAMIESLQREHGHEDLQTDLFDFDDRPIPF